MNFGKQLKEGLITQFRAPARVTFGPDEIFLSFASGGLLSFPGERK